VLGDEEVAGAAANLLGLGSAAELTEAQPAFLKPTAGGFGSEVASGGAAVAGTKGVEVDVVAGFANLIPCAFASFLSSFSSLFLSFSFRLSTSSWETIR